MNRPMMIIIIIIAPTIINISYNHIGFIIIIIYNYIIIIITAMATSFRPTIHLFDQITSCCRSRPEATQRNWELI